MVGQFRRRLLLPALAHAFFAESFTLHGVENLKLVRHNKMVMMAKSGPPQYQRRPARVVSNVEVGRGSHLIHVEAMDDEPIDYRPGHVLALEIKDPDDDPKEEWMRGPYTVTRADDKSFQILYRVVGKKTKTFQKAPVGTKVQFGGKFKVPVFEGINPSGLERVVGISTGVGIGPLLGFAEQALEQEKVSYRIDIFAAFRHEDDICCSDALNKLASEYPNQFSWAPLISSTRGRISDIKNLEFIAGKIPTSPGATHYHMIGNGSMVNELTAGLAEAGIPNERVTLEMYFNHKESPRPAAVQAIGDAFKKVATVECRN